MARQFAMLTLLPLLFVGVIVAVLVHEAGHAVAARLCGGRRVAIRFGWPAAHTEAALPAGRVRQTLFLLGGAIANMIVGAPAIAFGGGSAVVGFVCCACAIANLWPHDRSDGAQLLALWVRSTATPGAEPAQATTTCCPAVQHTADGEDAPTASRAASRGGPRTSPAPPPVH